MYNTVYYNLKPFYMLKTGFILNPEKLKFREKIVQ